VNGDSHKDLDCCFSAPRLGALSDALRRPHAGDGSGWTPAAGAHTLTATPYSGQGATGLVLSAAEGLGEGG